VTCKVCENDIQTSRISFFLIQSDLFSHSQVSGSDQICVWFQMPACHIYTTVDTLWIVAAVNVVAANGEQGDRMVLPPPPPHLLAKAPSDQTSSQAF
jgi:hypothetical protein